jgi:transposase
MSQYDLTDFEWRVIEPLLPNKPRGVPRVDDRRLLNGIFWVLRSAAPWRDLPERYGPRTTCYNRFVRWRKAGVWDRLMDAITIAHDGDIQMIDSTEPVALMPAAIVPAVAEGSSRVVKMPLLTRKPCLPVASSYCPTIWSVSLTPNALVVPVKAKGSSKVLKMRIGMTRAPL